MVRKGGFEPPRLSAPPPQDGVSASSTTSAGILQDYSKWDIPGAGLKPKPLNARWAANSSRFITLYFSVPLLEYPQALFSSI